MCKGFALFVQFFYILHLLDVDILGYGDACTLLEKMAQVVLAVEEIVCNTLQVGYGVEVFVYISDKVLYYHVYRVALLKAVYGVQVIQKFQHLTAYERFDVVCIWVELISEEVDGIHYVASFYYMPRYFVFQMWQVEEYILILRTVHVVEEIWHDVYYMTFKHLTYTWLWLVQSVWRHYDDIVWVEAECGTFYEELRLSTDVYIYFVVWMMVQEKLSVITGYIVLSMLVREVIGLVIFYDVFWHGANLLCR